MSAIFEAIVSFCFDIDDITKAFLDEPLLS
jgi:hypothetical protein